MKDKIIDTTIIIVMVIFLSCYMVLFTMAISYQYDKLDLINLDKLRAEVDRKIAAINLESKTKN